VAEHIAVFLDLGLQLDPLLQYLYMYTYCSTDMWSVPTGTAPFGDP